jgi:hypothetical protein
MDKTISEARKCFDDLADQFAVLPGGSRGQMFGMPVAKVNGKAFMGLFQEEIILKLDSVSLKEALALPNAHLFDPMGNGRLMKEWVQIPFIGPEIWEKLARQARLYVHHLAEKNQTKP